MAESYHRFLKNGSVIFAGRPDGPDQLDPAREFGILARPIFSRRSDASTQEIAFGLPVGRLTCVDAGPRMLPLSRQEAHRSTHCWLDSVVNDLILTLASSIVWFIRVD
jgi:hypothetical protein